MPKYQVSRFPVSTLSSVKLKIHKHSSYILSRLFQPSTVEVTQYKVFTSAFSIDAEIEVLLNFAIQHFESEKTASEFCIPVILKQAPRMKPKVFEITLKPLWHGTNSIVMVVGLILTWKNELVSSTSIIISNCPFFMKMDYRDIWFPLFTLLYRININMTKGKKTT